VILNLASTLILDIDLHSVAEERSRLEAFRPQIDGLDPNGVDTERVRDAYLDALTELEAYDFLNDLGGGEQNIQDLIFPGGYTTSHSFSARGGDELTKFNASVSYLNDEGVALEDEFTRYNGSVKIDIELLMETSHSQELLIMYLFKIQMKKEHF